MELTVVHPQHLGSVSSLYDAWVYADEDLDLYEAVTAHFSSVSPLASSAEFQSVAAKHREAFVDWTEANMRGRQAIDWLQTPLHRNPFSSDLYLHLVWIDLVANLQKNNAFRLAVVTASPGLAKTFRELMRKRKGIYTMIGKMAFAWEAQKRILLSFAALGSHLIGSILRILLARMLLGKEQVTRLQGVDIFVETYLHPGDLDSNGGFRDRYFPGLVDWYRSRGYKPAVYPFLYQVRWLQFASTYKRMRRCAVPMAPFELFVGCFDAVGAACECLIAAVRSRTYHVSRFSNVDVNQLLKPLAFDAALRSFWAMLLLKAPRRLAEKNIRPNFLIDWYENQPIDKATNFGFKILGTQVIGVRQYVPIPAYLSVYSTAGEVKMGLVPETQWVGGACMPRAYDNYCNGMNYRIVPALRYTHVYRDLESVAANNSRKLLVLLTYSVAESMSILRLLFQGIHGWDYKNNGIVIKPHPDRSVELFRNFLQSLNSEVAQSVSWVSDSMEKLLPEAMLVVAAGSTSAAVEAICYGIPVILAGRQAGLEFNSLVGVDHRIWDIAYDSDRMATLLKKWGGQQAPLTATERVLVGESVRCDYFARVDDETMFRFDPCLDVVEEII